MPEGEIKDIYEKIEQGIDDVFESDKFKEFLKTMAKFHSYSERNIMLIHQQMPYATNVAGYHTWQDLGRQVNKGETGIRIIIPMTKMVDEEVIRDGKTVTEKVPVTRFSVRSVFDISQTTGRELPSPVTELTGDVKNFDKLYSAVTGMSEYKIVVDDIGFSESQKGMCDHTISTIFIRPGMSEAQTLKTAIHELFHSREHKDSGKPLNIKELEAEAAAYVVCSHFGLDTGDYSFGYLASWSNNMDHQERRRTIRSIRKEASLIIEGMENALKPEQEINRKAEDEITEHVNEKLQAHDIDADGVNVMIYDKRPEEKKDVVMYLTDSVSGYEAYMRVTGLTANEIKNAMEAGGSYSYLDECLMAYGGECRMLSDAPEEHDMSADLATGFISINHEKVTGISAAVTYKSSAAEDEMFALLNENSPVIDGAEVSLNTIREEPVHEPYTERLEKYEDMGYDSGWPMVGISYSNIKGMPAHDMNISEAVRFINRLGEETLSNPANYMKLNIKYTYNDWKYEHVQNLPFGSGRINFIDYLNLPANVTNHLKTHAELLDMLYAAENFASDTTYGREYADRMQEWAEYCRMELNHNSKQPVIPMPPVLDDLYNINASGLSER